MCYSLKRGAVISHVGSLSMAPSSSAGCWGVLPWKRVLRGAPEAQSSSWHVLEVLGLRPPAVTPTASHTDRHGLRDLCSVGSSPGVPAPRARLALVPACPDLRDAAAPGGSQSAELERSHLRFQPRLWLGKLPAPRRSGPRTWEPALHPTACWGASSQPALPAMDAHSQRPMRGSVWGLELIHVRGSPGMRQSQAPDAALSQAPGGWAETGRGGFWKDLPGSAESGCKVCASSPGPRPSSPGWQDPWPAAVSSGGPLSPHRHSGPPRSSAQESNPAKQTPGFSRPRSSWERLPPAAWGKGTTRLMKPQPPLTHEQRGGRLHRDRHRGPGGSSTPAFRT